MLKPKCTPITSPVPQPPFTVTFVDLDNESRPYAHVSKVEAIKMVGWPFENITFSNAKDLVELNFGFHDNAWYSICDLARLIAHIAKEKNSILRENSILRDALQPD